MGPNQMGNLAIKTPWPSMMSAIWKNEEKYQEYFRIPGWYIQGTPLTKTQMAIFGFKGV